MGRDTQPWTYTSIRRNALKQNPARRWYHADVCILTRRAPGSPFLPPSPPPCLVSVLYITLGYISSSPAISTTLFDFPIPRKPAIPSRERLFYHASLIGFGFFFFFSLMQLRFPCSRGRDTYFTSHGSERPEVKLKNLPWPLPTLEPEWNCTPFPILPRTSPKQTWQKQNVPKKHTEQRQQRQQRA